ncbi:MAG: hypothetical protein KF841_08055 [Phycisphaerae bacterium]|nr:hypothetical protein [Phycisphaerae bacterium]
MTQTDWRQECHRAAALFDQNDPAAAAAIFEDICARPELGQSDRALMFVNLATIYAAMNRFDDTMAAFDNARRNALQVYLFVEQSKAVTLIRQGRSKDAIPIIEQLLANDALTGDYRTACEENLKLARQHAAGGGRPPGDGARYSEAPRQSL